MRAHKLIQFAAVAGIMVSLAACHMTDGRDLSGLGQIKRCGQGSVQQTMAAPAATPAQPMSAPTAPDFKYTKGSATQDSDK